MMGVLESLGKEGLRIEVFAGGYLAFFNIFSCSNTLSFFLGCTLRGLFRVCSFSRFSVSSESRCTTVRPC